MKQVPKPVRIPDLLEMKRHGEKITVHAQKDKPIGCVEADAALPVEDRATVLEPDRDRTECEQRARERQPERGAGDVEGPVQRVPSAFSQTGGTPVRR